MRAIIIKVLYIVEAYSKMRLTAKDKAIKIVLGYRRHILIIFIGGKMMKRKSLLTVLVVLVICMMAGSALANGSRGYNATYLRGDCNLDNKVNTGDATLVLRSVTGSLTSELTGLALKLSDANADSKVNTGDATYILRVVTGLAPQLYLEEYVEVKYSITFDAGMGTLVNVPEEMVNGTMSFEEHTDIVSYLVGENAVKAELANHRFLGWSIDGITVDQTCTAYPIEKNLVAVAIFEEVKEADINFKFYDIFNEVDTQIITQQTFVVEPFVLNAASLVLPEGYKLDNPNLTININANGDSFSPNTYTVNVYPYTTIDGAEFKIINTLRGFLKVQNGLDKNYIMDNDISLASIRKFIPFGWNWQDITIPETYFTGIFDGNGHKVTDICINLTMEWVSNTEYNANSNVGLFAINDGIIRNLSVYTRDYTGDINDYGIYGDINVGIIAGYNNKTIENCHAFGNVGSLFYVDENYGAVGGICGTNGTAGKVLCSSFEGGCEGFFHAGGLIGKNFGTIDQSYFAGGVNWGCDAQFAHDYSIRYVGGICGSMQYATITNCYACCTYNLCTDYAVGGICGWVKGGQIRTCYIATPTGANFYFVSAYGGAFLGYIVENPQLSGVYDYNNYTGFPAEFDAAIWDMGASLYSNYPDIIKNRRGISFYEGDG